MDSAPIRNSNLPWPPAAERMIAKVVGRSIVAFGLLCFCTASAQTLSGTESVALALSPAAILYSVPLSLSLISTGSFSSYSGSLIVNMEVRTSASGTGSLTLQATSDFTPTTGPKVSSGNLSYQCLSASYGTACSGQVQASTTSQTTVASYVALSCTGGGGACSNSDPNTVTVQFTVPDKSTYVTGNYSATITFTVSAT